MSRTENHDSKAWRARAEECRAIADTFDNPETRAKMYEIAADYERMADRADRRERQATADGPRVRGPSPARDTGTSP